MARVVDPRTFRFNPTCVALTVAPGTTLAMDIGRCEIETVRVIIPDGHCGLTSLSLEYAGITVLPFGPVGGVLKGNDHDWTFPFGDFEVGAPITCRTLNADVYDHGWEIHFIVHQIPLPPPVAQSALVLG